MRLVVGLGNPGRRYEATRHNVGFMAVEAFLSRHRRSPDREERGALVAEARWSGETLLVVRPLSFMNLSGGPVGALARRGGLGAGDVVLLYDDSDLPMGAIRVRPGGSPAGHRGVESVTEALGSSEIPRIRLGIGRPEGPHGALADFVLEEFEEGERELLGDMLARSVDALQVLLKQGVKAAMNLYNQKPGPRDIARG